MPDLFATDEDDLGAILDGYWDGEFVNGIPVAYFTKEQGDKVVEAILRTISTLEFYRARYSAELDAFIFNDGYANLEVYEGRDVTTNDGSTLRLYNIGGRGGWNWQFIS